MITITNIRNINPLEYDEIWAIVRSLKSKSSYLTHVPELSPSWSLFKLYMSLKIIGQWNENSFQSIYAPQFQRELQTSNDAQEKIDELIKKDKNGAKIALVCFCKDPNLCHRSIISKILTIRNVKHTLS